MIFPLKPKRPYHTVHYGSVRNLTERMYIKEGKLVDKDGNELPTKPFWEEDKRLKEKK